MLSILSKLKTVDVYRKVPKDLTEASIPGGVITIMCAIVLIVLFISEFWAYINVSTTSTLFVDVDRGGDSLRINLHISLPNLNCDILSLDAQDIMGKHMTDVSTHIRKTKINSDQGCNLKGFLDVSKVAGNFHISSHGKAFMPNLNLEHTIHELSFGDANTILAKRNAGLVTASFNPLDGMHKESNEQNNLNFEYFIQVVPTSFETIDGEQFHSYQFTVNSATWGQDGHGHQMNAYIPSIYFRYEFSPITVKFTQSREGFFHFTVQLCAIVGGVFTAAGIAASLS